MRSAIGVSLLSLALIGPALAEAGPKSRMPQQIVQARYVCLGYDVGDRFLSETQSISAPYDVYPEDRRILEAVRDEMEKWGRYVITVQPRQAEILIAVRAGRLAGATTGIGIGTGGRRERQVAGGEVSTPWDTFTVYESRGGQPGASLWRVQKRGALAGSPPRAFEDFRAAVELAPAPTKTKTP